MATPKTVSGNMTVKPAISKPVKKSTAKNNSALYMVKSSRLHGNGVFAARKIDEDTRISEYVGKRTAWKQALKRDPADPENPYHTFLFDLGDGRYVLDAAIGGNDSRWINHACEPNC